MTTALSTHQWVRWSLEEVAVIVDPFTGASSVVVPPDAAVGEQIGCQICNEPLTDSSAVAPCRGDTVHLAP